jgi:hypothetical protein
LQLGVVLELEALGPGGGRVVAIEHAAQILGDHDVDKPSASGFEHRLLASAPWKLRSHSRSAPTSAHASVRVDAPATAAGAVQLALEGEQLARDHRLDQAFGFRLRALQVLCRGVAQARATTTNPSIGMSRNTWRRVADEGREVCLVDVERGGAPFVSG